MRRKMNYRHGKYRRRYVPSLYENIYEETESYSSCMDMNGDFIVFGSENGSVLLWKLKKSTGKDFVKKIKIR